MIYFIQGDRGGPIKIGCAGNPWQRLATLQTGNPTKLSVVAVVPGERAEEAGLHVRFAASRGQGEWFTPTPDLLAFIDGIRAAQRDAPPKPMAVDEDMLLGLSRDQVEAVLEAERGMRLCRRAAEIIVDYYDCGKLPESELLDAEHIIDVFQRIESELTAQKTSDLVVCNTLAGLSFFDGHGGWSRVELLNNLLEMLARHNLVVAESVAYSEADAGLPNIYREQDDDNSAASDFTIN